MKKFFYSLASTIFILTAVFSASVSIQAQQPPPPPPPPAPREGIATRIGSYNAERDEEDGKGSTVRGRAFYQDTTGPVRRGWIGLKKIRDLVEKTDGDSIRAVSVVGSYDAEKYVLTNDNGEFVVKNIKAGIYQPVFKVAGILNINSTDAANTLYPPITVDGISEITVQVPAKRGGSVSGRVQYFDGTPVIGARVQIVNKKPYERVVRYGGEDNTSGATDDRGFYHFAGLPDGEYFVRVTEPSVHNEEGGAVQSYDMSGYSKGSVLTTFYPNVSKTEDATAVNVAAGREQTDINVSIPDRRLFRISGAVVAKNNKTPLKNLKVTFQKNDEEQIYSYSYDQSKQARTDEQGKWAFVDLPKGKYTIKVSGETNQYAAKPATQPDTQPKYATVTKEIEIDNESVQDLVLEMTSESAISGTVVVEGGKDFPPYVFFSALDEKTKSESSASVSHFGGEEIQPNGKTPKTFRIGSLAAGKYNFVVRASGDFYVKSARSGSTDLLSSPVEIGEGDEIKDVQVVLATDVGTLNGKINGYAPTEQVFVILLPVNKSGLSMLTNGAQGMVGKTGEFSIKSAPGEYYAVTVGEANRPKNDNLTEWLTAIIAAAPKVTLRAKETATTTLDAPKK